MLYIKRIGYKFVHKNGIEINRPNGSGDYLLICFKTTSYVNLNNSIIHIDTPCFVIYDKGYAQHYYHDELPYIDDFLHFDSEDEDIPAFISSLELPFNTPLYVHNVSTISSRILSMMNEYYLSGNHKDEILDLGIKSVLYMLSDAYYEDQRVDSSLNSHRAAFNDIRNKIFTFSEDSNISVNSLSSSLGLSTSYFQHVYKQLFGVTVVQDIIRSRIEYASNLLINNSDSIGDIARRCGYDNPEHFSRQFKEHTGYSPRKYRSECLVL